MLDDEALLTDESPGEADADPRFHPFDGWAGFGGVPWRLVGLAASLLVAAALVTVGVFQASQPAGWVVAGALFAAWAWLIFGESP